MLELVLLLLLERFVWSGTGSVEGHVRDHSALENIRWLRARESRLLPLLLLQHL